MRFKNIQTQRLTIRRLELKDAEAFSHYRSHADVAKYQSAYSIEKTRALILEMQTTEPSVKGRWFQFAIELQLDGKIIGDIGFFNTDENEKSWIGFTLNPKYWHNGYAKEAVSAVLNFYRENGISDVWAATDPLNESSMHLLKRLGFKQMQVSIDELIFLSSN